jgi:ABC-2 type transport system permease protein
LSGAFEVEPGEVLNGYFICFFILNLLLVHVPILVALIAGDMIQENQIWERFACSYQNR